MCYLLFVYCLLFMMFLLLYCYCLLFVICWFCCCVCFVLFCFFRRSRGRRRKKNKFSHASRPRCLQGMYVCMYVCIYVYHFKIIIIIIIIVIINHHKSCAAIWPLAAVLSCLDHARGPWLSGFFWSMPGLIYLLFWFVFFDIWKTRSQKNDSHEHGLKGDGLKKYICLFIYVTFN